MSCQDEDNTIIHRIEGKLYVKIDDFYIEMTHEEKIRRCLCCGGITQISYGGSLILIHCVDEVKDDYNFKCSNQSDCKGIELCTNSTYFDADYSTIIVKRTKELLDEFLDMFDIVIISSTPETRKVVAENYFQNSALYKEELSYNKARLLKLTVNKRDAYLAQQRKDYKKLIDVADEMIKGADKL